MKMVCRGGEIAKGRKTRPNEKISARREKITARAAGFSCPMNWTAAGDKLEGEDDARVGEKTCAWKKIKRAASREIRLTAEKLGRQITTAGRFFYFFNIFLNRDF
jgi:hypothetical protein